jgi:integrase/recombinase XerD
MHLLGLSWLYPKGEAHALVPQTRTVLKAWLKERASAPDEPLFPTTTGKHLSRDAIERRLARHLANAAEDRPTLKTKHVTMHTLRHTAAMRLLLAGNDVTVIALWLGHEQISTTNVYLHADMTHKQQAIDRTNPDRTPNPAAISRPTRFWPSSENL